jgi:phage protein D
LNAARHSRSFVTQKDSAVAEEIGKLAGVTLKATDSGVTHPYLLQAGQTDLEFLLERARRIQYELAMDSDGATVLFRPVANAAKEVATLTLDDHLLEFRPRLSLVPVTQLTVRGWDPKESQPVTASSRAGDQKLAPMGAQKSSADYAVAFHRETAGSKVEPWLETMVRDPVASAAEADQMAVGRFNAAALDFIRGDGRCRGRTDMRAGKVVRIDRIGSRFSGPYYVTSAVHSYTRRGGYITTFQVRRNAS